MGNFGCCDTYDERGQGYPYFRAGCKYSPHPSCVLHVVPQSYNDGLIRGGRGVVLHPACAALTGLQAYLLLRFPTARAVG